MSIPTNLAPQARVDNGQAARKSVPRQSLGVWELPEHRADPVALLVEQSQSRLQNLVPIRHGRMSTSAFAFYRGSAVLMAADLGSQPNTGLQVQLCGDAHVANFGMFASPERTLLFDLNDFDETHPGPFEWDVKRLAASAVLTARSNGWSGSVQSEMAQACAQSYREAIRQFADMGTLDVWYSRLDMSSLGQLASSVNPEAALARVEKSIAGARKRTNLQAMSKLTEVVDGQRQFVEDPPLLTRVGPEHAELLGLDAIAAYRATLVTDRAALLDQFEVVDIARKVVGVGSVGTRCYVLLLQGVDGSDPLVLQFKEATASVLEPYTQPSQFDHHGARVVAGQRVMQAATDIFIGWTSATDAQHGVHDTYVRQLRDMKFSPDLSVLEVPGLTGYLHACGWTLARAHARSGDRLAISAYLGGSTKFDAAIASWSMDYADQAEVDHAAMVQAIRMARIPAITGV
ncbi:MAG: DUF2252 domain-containing protein [Candidatus Nanopelagicales bacterium]